MSSIKALHLKIFKLCVADPDISRCVFRLHLTLWPYLPLPTEGRIYFLNNELRFFVNFFWVLCNIKQTIKREKNTIDPLLQQIDPAPEGYICYNQ